MTWSEWMRKLPRSRADGGGMRLTCCPIQRRRHDAGFCQADDNNAGIKAKRLKHFGLNGPRQCNVDRGQAQKIFGRRKSSHKPMSTPRS
jgi:hypothetical protein